MVEAQRPAGAAVRVAVVTLPAEIDPANAARIGEDLQAACAPGVTTVVADMTATTFCDSIGVRTLVLARHRAAASGAELRVVVPSAHILRVLAILGVDCLLAIYPSLQEALAYPGLDQALTGALVLDANAPHECCRASRD